MQAQLKLLQTQGLTPSLLILDQDLQNMLRSFPVAYDRGVGPAPVRRGSVGAVMTPIMDVSAATAAATSYGCYLAPELVFPCQAAAGMGLISGTAFFVWMVACT